MKIKKSLLFVFMSWMKNGSHGIAEKKKVIIMTKNGKQATITKSKDEYLEMNDYCEQRYRLFLKQWLDQGQDFLFELMAMGMISVKRNRQQIGLIPLTYDDPKIQKGLIQLMQGAKNALYCYDQFIKEEEGV